MKLFDKYEAQILIVGCAIAIFGIIELINLF